MSRDTISVAEFLESEFFFELAQYFECEVTMLKFIKQTQPTAFKQAVRYVLRNNVTSQCRIHVTDKLLAALQVKQSMLLSMS